MLAGLCHCSRVGLFKEVLDSSISSASLSLVMKIDILFVMRRAWGTAGEDVILGCFGGIKI